MHNIQCLQSPSQQTGTPSANGSHSLQVKYFQNHRFRSFQCIFLWLKEWNPNILVNYEPMYNFKTIAQILLGETQKRVRGKERKVITSGNYFMPATHMQNAQHTMLTMLKQLSQLGTIYILVLVQIVNVEGQKELLLL